MYQQKIFVKAYKHKNLNNNILLRFNKLKLYIQYGIYRKKNYKK